MKKDLGWIVIGALLIGVCLSIVLCIASFAKLSRIERDVRMAEERLRVEESKPSSSLPECGGAVGTDIEIARLSLHAAYKVESDDFYASHKNMGGGNYSYAMLCARRGGIGTADLCQFLAWRRKLSVKNVRIRVASGIKMCYSLV